VEDISLHVLDIAENSIRADAKRIEIILTRDLTINVLRVDVKDDGKGMDPAMLAKIRDPFYTTKHKKTGLGIPLLDQAAEMTGGALNMDSSPGAGTSLSITFPWSHVDRPAIGSMADTLLTLVAGHPDVDIVYEERDGGRTFRFDTREVKNDLDDVPINTPAVLDAIRDMLKERIIFER
jgi:hypothetical protein